MKVKDERKKNQWLHLYWERQGDEGKKEGNINQEMKVKIGRQGKVGGVCTKSCLIIIFMCTPQHGTPQRYESSCMTCV